MTIAYESDIVIGSNHWTDQWLSFGRVHNHPERMFVMRTHKPNHWGGDERFVLRSVSQYDSSGKAIAFNSGNVRFGDDVYLYSVSHSIYLLATGRLDWARFAKSENQRITFVNADDPTSRDEITQSDTVAIQQYLPGNLAAPVYLTYDDSDDGLWFDKSQIQAYERWSIQSY